MISDTRYILIPFTLQPPDQSLSFWLQCCTIFLTPNRKKWPQLWLETPRDLETLGFTFNLVISLGKPLHDGYLPNLDRGWGWNPQGQIERTWAGRSTQQPLPYYGYRHQSKSIVCSSTFCHCTAACCWKSYLLPITHTNAKANAKAATINVVYDRNSVFGRRFGRT